MGLLDNQMAAEAVDQVYMDLESQIMQNIARHLSDWKQPIDSDRWLMQKLAEIGKLNQENIKLIAKMSGISQTAAERMLNEMAGEAIQGIDPGLRQLSRDNLAGELVNPGRSRNVEQAVDSMKQQAKDTLNMCNTTMLYKARDAYTSLVQNIVNDAKEIENKQNFIDVLNRHGESVTAGVESRQQAVRKCIREFNEKGIPAFVDKRGRSWTPEAYVNMAMRNTARQTAEEVQTARCKDAGVNLIQIDSHSGARPKCAKDQGKIFSLDNTSGEVEDLNGRKIRYYPWSSSSYGEPDGILGINCRHHKWPFIPGVSIQRYFPTEDFEENDRLYKQTQTQRAMERDVRKQKRECMLYDEVGDKDAFEEAAVKLKSKEAALKNYVDNHKELHRRKDREQVVGFDRGVSTRATAANNFVEKYGKVRYDEDGTVIVTDYWNSRSHVSIPKNYKMNAIIETEEKKSDQIQINRTFYDNEGRMYKQIHSGNHANPKQHPYGENGEHAHDYEWENGKIVNRTTRDLTKKEGKENSDIL